MFKGMGDIASIMKQAQEMQSKMTDMQAELENVEASSDSGGGLVKVTVNAKGKIKELNIDPSILNADDKEMIEDLIMAAIVSAQEKAAEASKAEMAKLTEGLPLPPGMKLPF